MTNAQVLDAFERAGALLRGHFVLSSGLHSDQYLEKFRLVENPALLEPLCEEIARRFRTSRIDYVMGPTTAGIILAYNVARHLAVGARYAEPGDSGRVLRRGQDLPAGARVLIVDDILTTGGSIRECVEVVAHHGAVLAGVGVLGDRSGGGVSFGAPLEALLTVSAATYDPPACPLCAAGKPAVKPGTRVKST